jgi:hypothetical protein
MSREEKKEFNLATDGAPMNTDKNRFDLNLSVFIGAPSVAKIPGYACGERRDGFCCEAMMSPSSR